MDIKIGNDIKLTVYLPEYIDPDSILKVDVQLQCVNKCLHDDWHRCCFDLYYPTEYTMHNHPCVSYNTIPKNSIYHTHGCCKHYYNRYNTCRINTVAKLNREYNCFNLWFSNTTYRDCGKYSLIVRIQTREDGWGSDNIHEYTVYYGPVFSISDRKCAKEGNIEITVSKGEIQNPIIENKDTVLLFNINGEVLYNTGCPIIINQ